MTPTLPTFASRTSLVVIVVIGVGVAAVAHVGLARAGAPQPLVIPPGVGQPGVGQPGVGQPGVGQRGVGQPRGPAAPGPGGAGGPATPNLILISMDTARADVAADPEVAPNLAQFAAEAVTFTQAWSAANTTSMSHAAVFTGRYPSEVGAPGPRFVLPEGTPTLAEVLRVYGYRSAAFTAGAHLGPGWGLDRGFDEYAATAPLGSFWHTAPAALAWLAHQPPNQAKFLFVHGYDAHAPYLDPLPYGLAFTPRGYRGLAVQAVRQLLGTELWYDQLAFREESMLGAEWSTGRVRPWDAPGRAAIAALADSHPADAVTADDEAYVRGAYRGAVAYADANLGWFFAQLRAAGRFDDSVIVVMGDHGEALGEGGRFGHGGTLADVELHVPLYVHVPHAAPRTVDEPVSLLDLLPTLVDYAGGKPPANVRGASLRPAIEGSPLPADRVVFAESNFRAISARGPAGRLTFSGIDAGSPFLADLVLASKDADPAWSLESDAPPADRASLRAALEAWRASVDRPGQLAPADPHLVEEMKQRGYFTP